MLTVAMQIIYGIRHQLVGYCIMVAGFSLITLVRAFTFLDFKRNRIICQLRTASACIRCPMFGKPAVSIA